MFLRSRSLQIILALLIVCLFEPYLPDRFINLLYMLSVNLKDLLMWIIPLTAFFFLSDAIASYKQKAPYFLSMLLSFEAISNFACLWYAFAAGTFLYATIPALQFLDHSHFGSITCHRFLVNRPEWWSADKGVIAGILFGLFAGFFYSRPLSYFLSRGKAFSDLLLTKFFSRLLPLFIVGFVANGHPNRSLSLFLKESSFLFIQLICILSLYLIFLFLVSSKGCLLGAIRNFMALSSAGVMAFFSGCSLSTMPSTIKGCQKILIKPSLAASIIPATTNIQQIGDCIVNSFLCFLIYTSSFGHFPSPKVWLIFSLMFTLARFATAAVLGGAIFLMLPIYEKYLSFNPEMIALILALNIFLDPVVTSSNVMANGALCKIFENVWLKALQKLKMESPS